MLAKPIAACTHLSSTFSQLFEPQVQKIAVFTYHSPHFYRAMLCKRGLSCHAVSVRPSVTFVDHVKTNKHIFEIFSASGSDTILVFPSQRGCRYSWETVEDRRVHAAKGSASIELSFHSCNILRDSRRCVSRRNKNVGCGT